MAVSNPVSIFGACRVVLYDTATGEFFGPPIKVLQSTGFSSDKELIENSGGCSAYPYSVATGRSTAEGTVSFNELSPWMFAKMAGGQVTINGAEAGGNVSALTEMEGASINDATDGIEITALTGSEANLAFGSYRVIVKTATTVDVYLSASSLDDSMIIGTDLDVSAQYLLSDFGLQIDPASVTDLTVGDIAVFDVRPINSGSSYSIVGGSADSTPEVGILMYVPKQDGTVLELDVFRTKFAGIPLNFTSNEYASFETSFKAFKDEARDGVYSVTMVNGVS